MNMIMKNSLTVIFLCHGARFASRLLKSKIRLLISMRDPSHSPSFTQSSTLLWRCRCELCSHSLTHSRNGRESFTVMQEVLKRMPQSTSFTLPSHSRTSTPELGSFLSRLDTGTAVHSLVNRWPRQLIGQRVPTLHLLALVLQTVYPVLQSVSLWVAPKGHASWKGRMAKRKEMKLSFFFQRNAKSWDQHWPLKQVRIFVPFTTTWKLKLSDSSRPKLTEGRL